VDIKISNIMNKENKGRRVELIKMDDPQAPEVGTKGTVQFEDGMKQIHVKWDSGSSLALIPGEDEFRYIEESVRTIKGFEQFKEGLVSDFLRKSFLITYNVGSVDHTYVMKGGSDKQIKDKFVNLWYSKNEKDPCPELKIVTIRKTDDEKSEENELKYT
jgi:hypothetical protein